MVNIKGIDKVELLKALWDNSKPAIFFILNNIKPPQFDYNLAKEAVLNSIDYFQGRLIKCDLSMKLILFGMIEIMEMESLKKLLIL